MKLEFRPSDQKNFYDVLLIDFESGEVVILIAGQKIHKKLTEGELKIKGEQGRLF